MVDEQGEVSTALGSRVRSESAPGLRPTINGQRSIFQRSCPPPSPRPRSDHRVLLSPFKITHHSQRMYRVYAVLINSVFSTCPHIP